MRFCHKHDPDSKEKIENTVNYIKTGFLKGKVYEGIDVLNSSCLEWLDRFANGDYHSFTKEIPNSNNLLKRTIKKPKLYFGDLGPATHIINWGNYEVVRDSSMSGHYFENFVISELKRIS